MRSRVLTLSYGRLSKSGLCVYVHVRDFQYSILAEAWNSFKTCSSLYFGMTKEFCGLFIYLFILLTLLASLPAALTGLNC